MAEFNKIKIINISSLSEIEVKLEFNRLVGSINLTQQENYDCTRLNVWSYRKATDVRDGVNIKFGNMCNGFPFDIAGIPFVNSECAYVAGAFAREDPESARIQRLITLETNGQKCKRVYRRLPEFTQYMRDDFYTYNVQWMLYVIWQKCQQNDSFAELLKKIPIDAYIVENTSLHHGESATFWGARNTDLMTVRKEIEDEIARNQFFKYKYKRKEAQMLASNAVNDIGCFIGTNVMGKIIKICSFGLLFGQEPPIDYSLLMEKGLTVCGNRINFPMAN